MSRPGTRWLVPTIAVVLAVVTSCSSGGDVTSGGDAVTSAPTTGSASASPSGTVTAAPPAITTAIPGPTPSATATDVTTAPASGTVSTSVDRTVAGVGDPDAPILPDGFRTVPVQITTARGAVCIVCAWSADDATSRSRGLMGVTDLGEPVGMAFSWDAPTSGNFFMFQTPMPLSIAWFDSSGEFVDATDMAPCRDANSAACERYGPAGEYQLAIEVVQGELGALGIGPGASARIVDGRATCPSG